MTAYSHESHCAANDARTVHAEKRLCTCILGVRAGIRGTGPVKWNIVTVDLDSTMCDTTHRHKIIDRVNGTDWDAYSKACVDDTLIEATAAMVRALSSTHEIHYVSGRTIAAAAETEQWLADKNLPVDGLWLDDTPGGDHFAVYGGHAQYKVARVKQVAQETGKKVIFHIDDWAGVKVALEAEGIPCLCVRTPDEIVALTHQEMELK